MSVPPVNPTTIQTPKLVGCFKTVLLGAPGSFKNQLAEKVSTTFKMDVIPIRKRIYEQITYDTNFGKLSKKCLEKNVMIPEKIMVDFVIEEIEKLYPKDHAWLISGFPVTLSQAQLLQKHVELDCAFFVQLPQDVQVQNLLERYEQKREEASKETLLQIQTILDNYGKVSQPMLKFYEDLKIFKSVYSNSFEGVWEKFEKAFAVPVEEPERKEGEKEEGDTQETKELKMRPEEKTGGSKEKDTEKNNVLKMEPKAKTRKEGGDNKNKKEKGKD